MSAFGRLFFVALAYSFAFLHTVVPHHHADRGWRGAVIMPAGCALPSGSGLLQKVFATDLGYGHLEDFNNTTAFQLVLPSFDVIDEWVSSILVFDTAETSSAFFADTYIEKLQRRLLLLCSGVFRAPPF